MIWNILVWLILGGLVGWIASIIMRTDAEQGILLNVMVGIIGALIGALIFYRGDLEQPVRMQSFIVSLLGSLLFLAIVNLFRRGRVR